MQISKNEILFIYNSKDLQDRQALVYAKSLPNHRIKEVDLQKDSFTETQVKQIADMLEVEPDSLIDHASELYKENYSNVELTKSDALKAMASQPELIKTPIAVYNDGAEPISSPYTLVKKDLDQMPSINDFVASTNHIKIKHDNKSHRFYVPLGNEQMTLEYTKVSPDLIDFTGTFVPVQFRKRGLGSKLVRAGLEYAQKEGLKIKASCPFVADVVNRHPEYQHLLVS